MKDERGKNGEEWAGWTVRIDEAEGSMTPDIGSEISVGWNTEYSHYSPVKFYEIAEEEPQS